MRNRILNVVAFALLAAATAPSAGAETIVIEGGTVITVSGGTFTGSVVVEDGKIAEVGEKVARPAGARMIDARGRFVTPGIIDTHSHMGVYPWTIASTGNSDGNEATSPLTPQVRAADAVHLEDPAFERARAGGVTTILVLPGSANLIGGEGVVLKLRTVNTLDGMKFQGAPRQLKMAMGENPKRVYGGRTQLPSTRMGNMALLREAFRAARDYKDEFFYHWPFTPAHRDVLRDVLGLPNVPGRVVPPQDRVRLQVHCYTKSDILALLRVADEFGLEIAALHHALEAYKVAPELAKRKIGIATFSDWWGFKQEAWDAIPENAAICAKAGVKVSIHSDSSDHIQRLPHEAAKCVRHGMSAEDALKAVTLWPAEILGVGDRTGSIERGKDADLAIFSRHPFDILARVDLTMIDGKVVYERRERPEPAPVAEPEAFALVNARVLPVSRPPIERGIVVVRKGRIEAVGGLDVPVPADARRIDASGKTVVPGFIDANTRVGLIEVSGDPATHEFDESTAISVPHVRVTDGLNPESETVLVARAGGVTTAVVAPDGPLVAGQAAIVDLDGRTVADMVVRDPFALWLNLGGAAVGRGKGKNEFTTRMGLVAEIRDLFTEAREYKRRLDRHAQELERHERGLARRAREAAKKAAAQAASPTADAPEPEEPPLPPTPPDRKLRMEALLPALEGKLPVVVSAHRETDIRTALALAEEFGLRIILTHATEAYRLAPLLAERKIPVLVGPVTTQPSSFETWGAIYENAAILERAGVKIAIQTDSAHNVRQLPFQAGLAAAYGLPPAAALRAISLGPAEILGIDADYGSIDKGKVANLVVLTGDPLQPLSRVERVYIRGREVGRESHQGELLRRFGGAIEGR